MAVISTLNPPPQSPSVPSSSASAATASLTACAQALTTPELLIKILENLDQRSLGRTSRVSSLWLDASTFARMLTVMPTWRGASAAELSWLVARLREQPKLGRRVKNLALDGNYYGDYYSALFARIAIEHLIGMCPSIEHVTFFEFEYFSDMGAILSLLAERFPGLISFGAESCVHHDGGDVTVLASALRSFTNLKHLTLPKYAIPDEADLIMGHPAEFQLDSLTLDGPLEDIDRLSVEIFDWFLGRSQESLKMLRCHAGEFTSEGAAWLFANFKALEVIQVIVDGHQFVDDVDSVLQLLTLPKLEHAELRYWDRTGNDERDFEVEVDYTHKPPTVQITEGSSELVHKLHKLLGLDDE